MKSISSSHRIIDTNQQKRIVCAHSFDFSCTVLQIDVPLHRQKEIKKPETKKRTKRLITTKNQKGSHYD